MNEPSAQIIPPHGYRAVTSDGGVTTFEPTGELLDKTIGWRVTASEYASLLTFVEAFPQRTWSAAMRWLIDQPAVRQEMSQRVAASARRRCS